MKALVPALLVAALFLGACKSESKPAPAKSTTPAKANMGVMNSKCPVSGKSVDPDVTSDYKGGKVAFCCEGCQGKFAKMSDADKAAKVAAVK